MCVYSHACQTSRKTHLIDLIHSYSLFYVFINFRYYYLFRSAPIGFLSFAGLLASSPIGTDVAIDLRYVPLSVFFFLARA